MGNNKGNGNDNNVSCYYIHKSPDNGNGAL